MQNIPEMKSRSFSFISSTLDEIFEIATQLDSLNCQRNLVFDTMLFYKTLLINRYFVLLFIFILSNIVDYLNNLPKTLIYLSECGIILCLLPYYLGCIEI